MQTLNFEEVLDRLFKYGQRATYAGVGGLVGLPARSVMRGRPRTKKNSWVVAKKDGKPSGYEIEQLDPRAHSSPSPLSTPEDLTNWLKSHP